MLPSSFCVLEPRHGSGSALFVRWLPPSGNSDQTEERLDGRTLADRVEILEKQVTSLELLPSRIDGLALQIAQLREEMRSEFSAIRAEMGEETRALREEMRAGDAETRTFMRVLHEDLVDRIKLLGERLS